jgi:hypothetical protein
VERTSGITLDRHIFPNFMTIAGTQRSKLPADHAMTLECHCEQLGNEVIPRRKKILGLIEGILLPNREMVKALRPVKLAGSKASQ